MEGIMAFTQSVELISADIDIPSHVSSKDWQTWNRTSSISSWAHVPG